MRTRVQSRAPGRPRRLDVLLVGADVERGRPDAAVGDGLPNSGACSAQRASMTAPAFPEAGDLLGGHLGGRRPGETAGQGVVDEGDQVRDDVVDVPPGAGRDGPGPVGLGGAGQQVGQALEVAR